MNILNFIINILLSQSILKKKQKQKLILEENSASYIY